MPDTDRMLLSGQVVTHPLANLVRLSAPMPHSGGLLGSSANSDEAR
jgi:hypothetical protein